jgi:hypothetical protein
LNQLALEDAARRRQRPLLVLRRVVPAAEILLRLLEHLGG